MPNIAITLRNLAQLYAHTNRPERAESCYDEALNIQRKLAKSAPEKFLFDVAANLYELGALYMNTRRPDKGEAAFVETAEILWCLSKRKPSMFSGTLTGAVYSNFMTSTQDSLRRIYFQVRGLSVEESESRVRNILASADSKCAGYGL
jgi:tetratricopeptide (TPR) repeat protein